MSGKSGFLEISTRYRKAARSAQQKALLLPIVISGAGLSEVEWIHTWIANRKESGLPVSGELNSAFMPAPAIGDKISWLRRPLTAAEVTAILRGFLACQDENLTSHSLKATTLSWCAKANVPREVRRILGRHSSSCESCCSRDLSYGPVSTLGQVMKMVKDGIFFPDAVRSNYFPSGNPVHANMPVAVLRFKAP